MWLLYMVYLLRSLILSKGSCFKVDKKSPEWPLTGCSGEPNCDLLTSAKPWWWLSNVE